MSYHWQFGDGTQQTTVSPTISHTYSILGNITPMLTVTDTGGLQHTAYGSLMITNANGNFPCQTSVQAIAKASCGQNNGSFGVNANGASYALYNASNTLIPLLQILISIIIYLLEYTLYMLALHRVVETL